jgi:hypothetical protein
VAKPPARHRRPWNPYEVRQLKNYLAGDTPTTIIALRLGRTPEAVRRKASQLRLTEGAVNRRPRTPGQLTRGVGQVRRRQRSRSRG